MTTAELQKEIASNILSQLGGNRFIMMTGAYNFVALESGMQFSFKGNLKVNKCKITLEVTDTYTVEFFKFSNRTGNWTEYGKVYTNVYNDMLQDIFTSVTGLYCTL